MTLYHARDLDQFVAEVDRLGTVCHPDAAQVLSEFSLSFDTVVDQKLNPFSEEYFQAQLKLYSEIAGRSLDQASGELTDINVDHHVSGHNPYHSRDVRFVSKHTRTVITCLTLADLPPEARILDVGCGWGMSSETMAFCGASVTAIDINAKFVELVNRRATRLSLPITAVQAEFDTFDTEERFDMMFFYECLHHSVKPWVTLANLARFVKPDGKIIFAGEPINAIWWRHWGIRLDAVSVYCIRKFGWWESGWSTDFIAQCFDKAGFTLQMYPHIGLDNGIVGAAVRTAAVPQPTLNLSVLPPNLSRDGIPVKKAA